jgi:hypothetical protein
MVARVPEGPERRLAWSATWRTSDRPWPGSMRLRGVRCASVAVARRDLGYAVVADLAEQGVVGPEDPEPAVAGAVPDGVGGQFVHGDDQVVGPAWRQPGLGGVRRHRGPQRVQRVRVEGLVQDRRARVAGECPWLGRWPAVAITGHRRSPG